MEKNNKLNKLLAFSIVLFVSIGTFSTMVQAEDTLLFEQIYETVDWAAVNCAYDSAAGNDYEVADNFWDITGSIDTIIVPGIGAYNDGSGWVEAPPDSTEKFWVRFYDEVMENNPIVAPTTGTYTISLTDDYGDGWNGGAVSVYVDGSAVITNITLANGHGPEDTTFSANAGQNITTQYTPGSWPYENYYAIYDPSDNLIGEDGTGGTEPIGLGSGGLIFQEPDWANPVSTQTITATVTDTGNEYVDSGFTLYNFTIVLNTAIDMENGWVSLQHDADSGGSDTWVLWCNSLEGDLQSHQRTAKGNPLDKMAKNTGRDFLEHDMAIQIWGDVVTNPVINIDTGEGFDTIQAAIDDNETLDGHTIVVSAGTYPEGFLYIYKSVTLLGPNAGLSGTSNARNPEAVICYPTGMEASSPDSWAPLIYIAANDVTINGFMVTDDGFDTSVNFSDCTAITNEYIGPIGNNTVISNNIVDGNFSSISVWMCAYPNDGLGLTGIEIMDNYMTGNHGPYHTLYLQEAAGIVSGNTIDDCAAAIQIQPYMDPVGGTVTNNILSGYINGIYYNYAMNGAAKWVIEENYISPSSAPAKGVFIGSADGNHFGLSPIDFKETKSGVNWSGLYLRTHGTSGTGSPPDVDFNDNVIDGFGADDSYWDEIRAVQIRNIGATSLGTFYGNTFTDTDVGVFVYNDGNVDNVAFHQNNFIDNLAGVDNTNTYEIDATCNWWGDITGPTHASNPTGAGESVTDNVDFEPWLTDAYPEGDCLGFIGPVHNLNTGEDFTTIQAAIDDTDTINGHTLMVSAVTHTEGPQITVSKDLTIMGLGCDNTIILANGNTGSSGDSRGWWLVNDGVELHLSDMKLDGNGYNIYQGIRHKGFGTITNVCFHNMIYPGYGGVAVAAFGTAGAVDISGCTFTEIGRIGVLYYGSGIAGSTFEGNTYIGKGDGDWLDYCLDISAGAGITVIGNTVSDCTGVASSDGSQSAGFMTTTYYGSGTSATIEENELIQCTYAVIVGYDETDTSTVTANLNNFIDCEWGIYSTIQPVDGTCNWWGDITGPYHPVNNSAGIGVNVSDNVTFLPWLDDIYPDGVCSGGLEVLDVNQSIFDRGYRMMPGWDASQEFTPTLSTLSAIKLYMSKFGVPTGNVTVQICDGSAGGTVLTETELTPGEVPSYPVYEWVTIDIEDVSVTPGEKYFIVLKDAQGADTHHCVQWGWCDSYPSGSGGPYDGGWFWFRKEYNPTWSPIRDWDYTFRTFGY